LKDEFCLLFPDFFSCLETEIEGNSSHIKEGKFIYSRLFKFLGPYRGYEKELLSLFGAYEAEETANSRLVSILAEQDLQENTADSILRADPVFLKADQNRVFLVDGKSLKVSREDAQRIALELNRFFHEDSIEFVVGKEPWRWYLKDSDFSPPNLASPFSLKGQPLEPTLSESRQMGPLKTFLTEVQMFLHNSSINLKRIEDGQLPVNSLWFWGGQHVRKIPRFHNSPFQLLTDCEMALSFANFFKFENREKLEVLSEKNLWMDLKNTLVVVDPTKQGFGKSVHKELARHVIQLLHSGSVKKLRIISRHGHFSATVFSKFRFWIWRRSLSDMLKNIDESRDILF